MRRRKNLHFFDQTLVIYDTLSKYLQRLFFFEKKNDSFCQKTFVLCFKFHGAETGLDGGWASAFLRFWVKICFSASTFGHV